MARGGAEEILQNGPSGVEQSWRFEHAPSGRGDLVVRVAASGLRYAGTTEGGLHFVDPATGVGVRYGIATFIDADGARTTIEPRFPSVEKTAGCRAAQATQIG